MSDTAPIATPDINEPKTTVQSGLPMFENASSTTSVEPPRAPLPPLLRRNIPVAAAPPDRLRYVRMAATALAPWGLLALLAAPLFVYYRVTLFSGVPTWRFDRPSFLALLGLVPVLAAWLFHVAPRRAPSLLFGRTADLRRTQQGWFRHLARLPQVLRLLALSLCALAIARPQHSSSDLIEVEGIDIVVALDVSNSMSEPDLEPDRITVAKRVLKSFIEHRKSDRIGLVIFGRDAFTQCPLTLDYHALTGLLDNVRLGLVDGRGTAIGNALATAENRLRKSEARSKVIILLTDGDNNAGNIAPQQAAKFAQSLGIKVFTILIGKDVDIDNQSNPFQHVQPRYPINPKLLEEIAGTTGGTPYLATDTVVLEKRFQQILDELDRSRIHDQKGKPRELYAYFVWPMLGLLLLEIALSLTRFRKWP